MSKKASPIPIKNLFYMLCYAWNVLAVADDLSVGTEDFDDAYNLLARVFSFGLGKLIRSGFHRSYVEKEEDLTALRGRIKLQESIPVLSKAQKKLVCSYDEYSQNDTFNQIIHFTISLLIRNAGVDEITKKRLRDQKAFFFGIDEVPPTKENRHKLVFNRNNVFYKLLINIAVMLYENRIVNEEDGKETFKDFYRREQMHRVFELFILNFYKIHLDNSVYKVHAPKIYWHLKNDAEELWGDLFEIDQNPGDRRTDIVIENKNLQLQLIFDAKYYEKTFVSAHRNEDEDRIRTGHLNQIRGYVIDSDYIGEKYGALIYPLVNKELYAERLIPIEGALIGIKTLDLNAEWQEIEADLLQYVNKMEEVYKRQSHLEQL